MSDSSPRSIVSIVAVAAALLLVAAVAGAVELPPRETGEGPFPRLVLRGVTLVDGTGAPPRGPVDVVVEGDRIVEVVTVGSPRAPIDPGRRPPTGEDGRELDLDGAWVLPGFVDLYGWPGSDPEYAVALWLAHGVTTVREPVCQQGMEECLAWRDAAAAGRVASPRVVPWLHFGLGRPGLRVADAEDARRWVAEAAAAGAAGVKFRGERPEVLAAALEEAERLGLPTSCHHSPLWEPRAGVLDTTAHGLDVVEHWYGLPEALLPGARLPDYPPGYDYGDEQHRFAAAGRLWRQAPPPGGPVWERVLGTLAERGVTLVPTLSLYEANRDLMRARRAEWHDDYTLPALWDSFTPSRTAHAAHFFAWTSEDEVAWRENYRLWMALLAAYRDRGGRVAVGTDAGFMYSLYGFAFVRELELLREAGFSPLEVFRAATLDGARTLGVADRVGSVEPGKLADLVVVGEDPLADLKVLYGTGTPRLGGDGRMERVGGVRYTIVGGVVYDAGELLAGVRRRVAAAREE